MSRLDAIYILGLSGAVLLIFDHPYEAAVMWAGCLFFGALEYLGQCWQAWLKVWVKFKESTRALVVAAFVLGLSMGLLLALVLMQQRY